MSRREPSALRTRILVERTFDLLRARCGPQDLPASIPLLWKLVWLTLLVEYAGTLLLPSVDRTPLRFALAFGYGLAMPWLLLTLMHRRARYLQTMSALLATGLVLSLVFLPLAVAALNAGMMESPDGGSSRQGVLALLLLAVVIWKVGVTANIWHHALEWPFAAGVGVALLMFALELGLDRLIFGGATT